MSISTLESRSRKRKITIPGEKPAHIYDPSLGVRIQENREEITEGLNNLDKAIRKKNLGKVKDNLSKVRGNFLSLVIQHTPLKEQLKKAYGDNRDILKELEGNSRELSSLKREVVAYLKRWSSMSIQESDLTDMHSELKVLRSRLGIFVERHESRLLGLHKNVDDQAKEIIKSLGGNKNLA